MSRFRFAPPAGALLTALLLSACGTTTIDQAGAQSLVKKSISKAGNTPGNVSCPSGVEAKAGGTLDCTFTATLKDGRSVSGTATVHILSSDGHVNIGASDFHVNGSSAAPGGPTETPSSPPSTTT